MKRKIALVLAAMMAITAVPATAVFATTTNSVATSGTGIRRDHRYDGRAENQGIAHFFDLVVTETIPQGTQFRLNLTNAEFTNLSTVTVDDVRLNDGSFGSMTLSAFEMGTTGLNNPNFGSPYFLGSMVDRAGSTTTGASLWGVSLEDERTNAGNPSFQTVAERIRGNGDARTIDELAAVDGNRYVWSNVVYYGEKGVGVANSADDNSVLLRRTGARTAIGYFNKTVLAGEVIRIPIPMTTDNVTNEVTVRITESGGHISDREFVLLSTIGTGTTTRVEEVRSGRDVIYLDPVEIRELAIGRFEGDRWSFELVAPAGYRFRNTTHIETDLQGLIEAREYTDREVRRPIHVYKVGDTNFQIDTRDTQVNTDGTIEGVFAFYTDDRDRTSMAISVDVTGTSRQMASSIFVTGLQIEPIGDTITHGEELYMGINRFSTERNLPSSVDRTIGGVRVTNPFARASERITEQNFRVATATDWTVSLTADDIVDFQGGRWEETGSVNRHATAEIMLEEHEASAWLANRTTTFTLPEGVSIRGIEITDSRNLEREQLRFPRSINASDEVGTITRWLVDQHGDMYRDTQNINEFVSISRNVLTLRDLARERTSTDDSTAMLEFKLFLSISPDFEDDEIWLQATGNGLGEELEVKVGNLVQPISVETTITDVQIGYQRYSVADIVITENFAGAIQRERGSGELLVNMSDQFRNLTGLQILPITEDQVTIDGDLGLNLRRSTTTGIEFDVTNVSRTASTITLSGVEVFVDRTVPYGVYDVVVRGNSVFANRWNGSNATSGASNVTSENQRAARFDSLGFKAPIINLATEGAAHGSFTQHVALSEGSTVALLNGEEVALEVAPYVSPTSHSLMMPLRFVANLFGIDNNNILFDNETRTATIIAPGRTVQFTGGSSRITVATNGASANQTMMTSGVEVFAEIDPVSERMFIPFRALGEAFGITDITWDESTRTAHYNRPVDAE